MKGQAPVVEYLKELLRGELAARDQYFLHSRMYADWPRSCRTPRKTTPTGSSSSSV